MQPKSHEMFHVSKFDVNSNSNEERGENSNEERGEGEESEAVSLTYIINASWKKKKLIARNFDDVVYDLHTIRSSESFVLSLHLTSPRLNM